MEIKRQIDTTNAKYSLENMSDEQFSFIRQAMHHYTEYTHHCIPNESSPIGELYAKIEKMDKSSLTIIK